MGWPRREPEPRPTPVQGVTREEFEERMALLEVGAERLQQLEARVRASIEDAKRANAELNNTIAAAHIAARRLRGGR